jgi:hypothetical protein
VGAKGRPISSARYAEDPSLGARISISGAQSGAPLMFGFHVPPRPATMAIWQVRADPSGGNLEPVGEGHHRERGKRDGYYSPYRGEEAAWMERGDTGEAAERVEGRGSQI